MPWFLIIGSWSGLSGGEAELSVISTVTYTTLQNASKLRVVDFAGCESVCLAFPAKQIQSHRKWFR
jgi:hypothetical protein